MGDVDPTEVADISQAPGLLEAIATAGGEILDGEPTPLFNADSIAAALVDRTGRIVCSSPAFIALEGPRHLDAEKLARAMQGASPVTVPVDLAREGAVADTAVFAYARGSQTAGWTLPPEVRAALQERPNDVVVLTSQASGVAGPLEQACRAYGFNGLQTRVALETVRTGAIRAAAERLSISYDTARAALAEALKRAGAPRLPALVSRLTSLAFGIMPDADNADVLGDVWGLTQRQAAIAGLIADGLSRLETARALGLSEAVVNKELDQVHLILQVSSAAALARKLVEARALRWLMRATGGDIGFVEAGAEPLRFVPRPGGGRIAISDYGPVSGRPVLVVHSSMTTRPVARGLRRALQAAGYRPISIDRPGFGLTDEVEGMLPGRHDCWATAAHDAMAVMDSLKLRGVDVVARGGAQFVLALEDAAQGRVGRVVLVNPDPPVAFSGEGRNGFPIMKQAWVGNPAVIRLTIRLLAQRFTYMRHHAALLRSVAGSSPDEAALADPEIAGDYFRAQRTIATGRLGGVVNEQTAITRDPPLPPRPGTGSWRVLVGAHDTMHDVDKVLAYWRRVLPDARFDVVADAGRFLAMSHPQVVVGALAEDYWDRMAIGRPGFRFG